MSRTSKRKILVFATVFMPFAIFLFGAQSEKKPASAQESKFSSYTGGATVPVGGQTGNYERVLLSPPEEGMLAGDTWEMNFDVFIKLSELPLDERWKIIKRNLGVSPDESKDWFVWSDVMDAILEQISMLNKLPPEKDPKIPAFRLRVGFPGKDASANAKPDVALTFNSAETDELFDKAAKTNFEMELQKKF